ncbi:MAG: 7-carboxy-7-deazaguanine synthase, partial [Verrucomicrobia bacterium]
AFGEGERMSVEAVLARVEELAGPATGEVAVAPVGRMRLPLVEVTGGEPLAQPGALELMARLCDAGHLVSLETSGALDIRPVDPRVHRIVDLKCPASGECGRNRWENLEDLRPTDELKCVIATVEDYEWAREQVRRRELAARCPVLFSWAAPLEPDQRHPSLKPFPADQRRLTQRELAERIVADGLPVRFQLQMHKVLWPAARRGV